MPHGRPGTAEDIGRRIADAVGRGVADVYEVLIECLDDVVEFRHSPPVPELDGWRDRAAAAGYLRTEAVAVPRAFRADLVVSVPHVRTRPDAVVLDPLVWAGTLRHAQGRRVVVPYRVTIGLRGGLVRSVHGVRHESADKADVRLWLEALDRAGGFVPPPARDPGAAAEAAR